MSGMRAIIVAAGMGKRLAPYTDDRPKCLVDINGKTLLERQLQSYRAAGVTDIAVVRGYRAEQIDFPGLRYFENPDFRTNNILASLFRARTTPARPMCRCSPSALSPRAEGAHCRHCFRERLVHGRTPAATLILFQS